jgi:hypothetical protein
MTQPYYADDLVTLYLGDCREVTEWLAADVLVTDPPYGIKWERGSMDYAWRCVSAPRPMAIAGDRDTGARDAVLAAWGERPAAVFGDLRGAVPAGSKQVLIYEKPGDAGTTNSLAGFRRDTEAIHLLGSWPRTYGGRSSILRTNARQVGCRTGPGGRYGHPHAKPVDVMETLIAACSRGTIADPFTGSGSTLVAARNLGRPAIGVEIEERYAERAAKRLCQDVLITGPV